MSIHAFVLVGFIKYFIIFNSSSPFHPQTYTWYDTVEEIVSICNVPDNPAILRYPTEESDVFLRQQKLETKFWGST